MSKFRNWCFTIFDIPEEGVPWDHWEYEYIIASLEQCPDTKRLHLQGYVEFPNPRTMKGLKRLDKTAHWESRKGTQEQAIAYCNNPDKEGFITLFIEDGQKNKQGSRTDLEYIRSLQNEDMNTLIENGLIKNYQQIKFAETLKKYQLLKPRTEPPEVHWRYGPGGTGKTRFIYDNYDINDIYKHTFNDKGWWDNYCNQKIVLFDDVRWNTAPASFWLDILDRYPTHVPQRCRAPRVFNSPIIFITSDKDPKETLSKFSDEAYRQFERRITTITKSGTEVAQGNTSPERNIFIEE